jgi:DNA-binding NarL/FixJ family response regulator
LIVDDNYDFLVAARSFLKHEGIEVEGVASNSEEAIQQAAAIRPEVILLDVYLGEESGTDLARRLSEGEVGVQCRVILVSSYGYADLAGLIADSPAAGFLSKPDLSGRAIRAILDQTDGQ